MVSSIRTSGVKVPVIFTQMRDLTKYSMGIFEKRFGGWRHSLEAFVKYINETSDENDSVAVNKKTIKDKGRNHKTSRSINLRIRFLVLRRDDFKCCKCGASPAKDPSVILQVDHIIPWSKGGETVLENLQTLCSKCNIGKSDLI